MTISLRLTGGAVVLAAAAMTTSALAAGPTVGVAQVNTPALRVETPFYPAASPLERAVYDLVEIINEERQQRGLAPLFRNDIVTRAAQRHADDMAARRTMSHTGSDGSDVTDRLLDAGFSGTTWAENIGYGYREPAGIVQAWIDSPGHRVNLFGDFVYVGVGLTYAANGVPYWSLIVAS